MFCFLWSPEMSDSRAPEGTRFQDKTRCFPEAGASYKQYVIFRHFFGRAWRGGS